MLHIIKCILRWLFDWLYFVSLVCMTGSLLGVSSHLAFALCFVETPDYSYYAALGFLHGLKYGSVWAGGVAVVLCVMRARNEYLKTNGLAPS